MDGLKLVLDKLSQYNFLTNILPGTVLCILLKYWLEYDVIPSDYYQAGIVFYFVGMVNNRVGSLIIEPILKKIKFIRFAPYEKFVMAEQKDTKVTLLNQENNTYRSYISVFFILICAYAYLYLEKVISFINSHEIGVLVFILFILFVFSYRKQTSYVRKRVENLTKDINRTE